MKIPKNKIEIRLLTDEEGGGYLVTFPELPGCMSDGDSPAEALSNAAEAEAAWLAANAQWSGSKKSVPARLVARLPRTIHLELQRQAAQDGVSINTMIVSLVSHGLGELASKHGHTTFSR